MSASWLTRPSGRVSIPIQIRPLPYRLAPSFAASDWLAPRATWTLPHIVEDDTVRCHSPNRLASTFTRFERLLALRDRLTALFRRSSKECRSTRLLVETMEERIVP